MQRICVFCGSSTGGDPIYNNAARYLGALLAERKLGLVYGGGHVGLMGVLADAVLAGGGEVIGIIPTHLAEKELAHQRLTELHVVGSMHERKAMMADKSDAFVALPGGYGTFEEFFESLTWAQLGLHEKPCGLLNVAGFYDALLGLVDHAVTQGFIRATHRDMLLVDDDPARLLDRFKQYRPVAVPKWITSSDL
ncbi:MAG: TIGR00730 family Rossman fold protein [Anaerolineae bacterium]